MFLFLDKIVKKSVCAARETEPDLAHQPWFSQAHSPFTEQRKATISEGLKLETLAFADTRWD